MSPIFSIIHRPGIAPIVRQYATASKTHPFVRLHATLSHFSDRSSAFSRLRVYVCLLRATARKPEPHNPAQACTAMGISQRDCVIQQRCGRSRYVDGNKMCTFTHLARRGGRGDIRRRELGAHFQEFIHRSRAAAMRLLGGGNGAADIVRRSYGLDYRSLALFRIVLGLVIVGDLADRAHDLHNHYTDDGTPRRTPSRLLTSHRSVSASSGNDVWPRLLVRSSESRGRSRSSTGSTRTS